jgi:hypothetical protein
MEESVVTVVFDLPNEQTSTYVFEGVVSLVHVGTIGDRLGAHTFNAYENGVLLGGWAVFKDGWNYCGR